ncbi:hypothetical protein CCACVL1_18817 [Corchorus capsularis]|uniref:BZIP domain-containing protein n=1 Tax=Corchorus capsularis TaxID=210143 RepID=A0A1R3HJR1_COCAP|nr:hypothetical protein CCACVL1_18817 [Corchorus capsularis]
MDQIKNEKDQNIQGFDLNKLLEDAEAFERVFFPPDDQSPDNHYVNQYCIDFNELSQILNEGNSCDHGQIDNNGGCHGNIMQQPVDQIANGLQGNVKQSGRGRRCKQFCPVAAHLRKLKNREAARRSFDQKKAYIQQLELEVQELRKQNANLMKSFLVYASASSSGKGQKYLRRTASGPV